MLKMKINKTICLFVLLFSVIILTTSVISATELNDTNYCDNNLNNDITSKQIEKSSNIDEKVETKTNEENINEFSSSNDYEDMSLTKDNNSSKSKLGISQTSVTLQTPTVTAGETSTIKVNVKTSNVPVSNGRVSISFNNKWIGSPGVSNGIASMNYNVPSTYNGNYPIKMTYINNNNQEISTSTKNINVIKPTNKISMSIPSTAFAGTKIKLNATVTDLNGNKVNTGRVSITFNNKWIGSPGVNNGFASMDYTIPSTYNGKYTVKMTYINTNNQEITSTTKNISITKPNNKITITVPSTAYAGIPVKLNSTVTDLNGNKVNTGRVSITFNNKWIGSPGINKGTASMDYTIPSTYNGKYTVKMTYINTNNQEVTSTTKNITVSKVTDKITISTPQTTYIESQITITTTVTDKNNVKVNTGRVSITFNNKWIGSPSIKNGVATMKYTIPNSYKGNYELKASYINTDNITTVTASKTINIINNIIYVNPNGNDNTATGTTSKPYKTINAAVSKAENNYKIKLMGGTYTNNNLPSTLYIDKNINITNYNNNVVRLTLTTTNTKFIIGSTVNFNGINFVNSQNRLIENYGTLTINNCNFTGNENRNDGPDEDDYGDMILTTGDSLIYNYNKMSISNSIFKNNLGKGYGGVIRAIDSTLTITSSTFDGNWGFNTVNGGSSNGGSLCLKDSTTTITNSKFLNNNAKQLGGAIFIAGGTTTINKSNFNNNTGMGGGVLYIRDNDGIATVKIYNSNFINNTAYREGGAIYNTAKLEINNSVFKYNIAEFGNGGAIVNNEGNMI
ncbi:MAG: hypothetical protein E7Z84_08465, partial [Methanosphaera stadtmanae]|nr:hypothetical protein [Methanosphaera stadtmanae]